MAHLVLDNVCRFEKNPQRIQHISVSRLIKHYYLPHFGYMKRKLTELVSLRCNSISIFAESVARG